MRGNRHNALVRPDRQRQPAPHPPSAGKRAGCLAETPSLLPTNAPGDVPAKLRQFLGPAKPVPAFCFWPFRRGQLFPVYPLPAGHRPKSVAAILLAATLGEFRILTLRETPAYGKAETPDNAADYWQQNIATDPRHNGDVESLVCLVLNTRREILGHFVVATGLLDTILCHPREFYRPAIVANATAIVAMHNHPSGDATPSEADIKVTRDLILAGQLLKIELLDHVIMGTATADRPGYRSLRGLGYFFS